MYQSGTHQLRHAPTRAVPRAFLPDHPLINLLLAGMVASLFGLSHLMLGWLGVRYEVPGGSVLEKVHPGTWLALLAFLIAMFASSDPLGRLERITRRHGGLIFFAGAWLVLLFHAVINLRLPFTPLIDSFLLPMLLLVLLDELDDRRTRRIALFIHAFMAINALLGIFEVASGWRLTPFVIGELNQGDDWRATALLGHPLNNAGLTAIYLLMLALGSAGLAAPLRLALFVLNLAAMPAFGGRVALVLLLALLAFIGLARLARVLAGARFSARAASLALLLAPLGAVILVLALDAGLLDRFLQRFIDDKGSAQARLLMLELMRHVPDQELLWGPDAARVAALMKQQGLVGLESFWVAFLLTYGAFASLVFFAGLLAFLHDLWRAIGPRMVPVIAFFLLEASTSVSLSAKTTSLGLLVLMAMTLLRDRKARVATSATPPR